MPTVGIKASGWLVEKEDIRPVQQTTHDLQLTFHASRKRFSWLKQCLLNIKQVREFSYALFIGKRHERKRRTIGIEAIERCMQTHIFLSTQIEIQAGPLKNDAN